MTLGLEVKDQIPEEHGVAGHVSVVKDDEEHRRVRSPHIVALAESNCQLSGILKASSKLNSGNIVRAR